MTTMLLDPSSKCCGVAIMPHADAIIQLYRVTPTPSSEPNAMVRAHRMLPELCKIARDHAVQAIVMEIYGKKPPRALQSDKKGTRVQYQAAYGAGVGVIWHGLMLHCAECGILLHTAPADEWASATKEHRAVLIAAMFPQYRAVQKSDTGLDVADAIALGRWWFGNQSLRKAGAA